MKFFAAMTFLAAGAVSAATPASPIPPADLAAPRPDYFQFAHMHEMHRARARVAPIDLLFLGDSITEAWWEVADFWWQRYGAHHPANFGISGDRTENLIWRLEHGALDHASPRVTVLMIGTNNSGDCTGAQIATGVRRIVALIREKCPTTRVLLLAIFPRGPRINWTGQPDDVPTHMRAIAEANTDLARLDDGDRIRFLDVGHVFLEADGTISPAVMPDRLHLSPIAYHRWADAMQPLLDEMLARPPISAHH